MLHRIGAGLINRRRLLSVSRWDGTVPAFMGLRSSRALIERPARLAGPHPDFTNHVTLESTNGSAQSIQPPPWPGQLWITGAPIPDTRRISAGDRDDDFNSVVHTTGQPCRRRYSAPMATGVRASFVGANVELPTGLTLPADARLPKSLAVREARVDEDQDWQRQFANQHLDLRDDRDVVAWFHFCTGHHVEFLYWEATAGACEHAIETIEAGDAGLAAAWIRRIATLVAGSGALLHYCAAFDPAAMTRV